MERDPKTGKFVSGNKVAVGNKGNRKPKLRNRNAVKHGYTSVYKRCWILEDGRLCIEMGASNHNTDVITFEEGDYELQKDGSIRMGEGIYGHLFGGGAQLVLQKTKHPFPDDF